MVWECYKPNFLGLGKSKKMIFEILTYMFTFTTALSIFFILGVCCYKRLKTLNSTMKIIYEELHQQKREKQTLKRQRYLPAESIYDELQILEEVSLRNLPPTVPYPRIIPEIIPMATVSSILAVNPGHPPKALYPRIIPEPIPPVSIPGPVTGVTPMFLMLKVNTETISVRKIWRRRKPS